VLSGLQHPPTRTATNHFAYRLVYVFLLYHLFQGIRFVCACDVRACVCITIVVVLNNFQENSKNAPTNSGPKCLMMLNDAKAKLGFFTAKSNTTVETIIHRASHKTTHHNQTVVRIFAKY